MPAPVAIQTLVNHFAEHIDAYKRGTYNETQLRREFLDPLFGELGWDVFNEEGYAGDYKDVVHEAAIKVGGTTKAPDYSFRIGGQRKFYVEAKKPSVDVKGDPHPAFQLRRYAWTAGLPLSILTDFEEFAVYDCRVKPDRMDKASTARIMYMTFREYDARWNEIADVFSKTAILKGAFDKYAAKTSRKRGTAAFDDAFLKELERWRTDLARRIARHNQLSARQLNHAVQLIIDRIVFLRICEDRGIEQAGTLQSLLNGDKVYDRLFERFRHADAKYNSGLFHFEHESGRDEPDTLTPNLSIGDNVLKDIIRNLYYPDAPYEFSVLPADILGHIYERFLGSIITLSPSGKTATVEEKPEVRKAGGVYYTPTYIVEHTVGELLSPSPSGRGVRGEGDPSGVGRSLEMKGRGKARGPAMNKPLRVLDPACGSGSFLLGAYQYLLEWHLKHYAENDPKSWATLPNPPIAHRAIPDEKATHSDYKLTTREKKRILTEHIFGVDIDAQAVEVTKLSLLLKVLEGENEQTLQPLLFAKERALPDLSNNIKCGNSLIGSDFYEGQQATMFDLEEQYRINAFDWEAEFPDIMTDDGFDAVIGNPPWGTTFTQLEREYLAPRLKSVADFESSQYLLFKGIGLLGAYGAIGMILPNTLALNVYAKPTRNAILRRIGLTHLLDLTSIDVFGAPNVRSMVLVGQRDRQDIVQVQTLDEDRKEQPLRHVEQSHLETLETWKPLFREADDCESVLARIATTSTTLDEYFDVRQGYIPYRTATLTRRFGAAEAKRIVKERAWHCDERASEDHERELQGRDVGRYTLQWSGRWVRYGEWVSTHLPIDLFRGHRVVLREITGKWPHALLATVTSETFVHNPSVLMVSPTTDVSAECAVGILNSKLMSLIASRVAPKSEKGLFPKVIITDARRLHFPIFDFDNPNDVAKHDRMVELVQSMLDMNKRLHGGAEAGEALTPNPSPRGRGESNLTPQERRVLEGRIAATDREIDQLVYDLYGLTDEEIAIVEAATA